MNDPLQCVALVFDFDGTLADSMPFLEKIGVEMMMKYYNVDFEDATQMYRSTTGLPYVQQIEINFPENPKNHECVEEFEKLKIERIYEQELFPETQEMVKTLSEKGLKLFVSSSTFQSTIIEYFDRRDLTKYFKEILGYRPGFEKGAHHFRHIENEHGLKLADVVFVGDSLKDFERSKGFCQFIGKAGIFTPDDFQRIGHEGYVIRTLDEVPTLVVLK